MSQTKLSAEARGVLVYILELDEAGEVVDRDKLRTEFGIGLRKLARITRELQELKLLELVRISDEKGRFTGWKWSPKVKESGNVSLYGSRARIHGPTKRDRAEVLVNVLKRIRSQVDKDKHFRDVISAAIAEVENTQRPVQENLDAIVRAVGNSHAHTYEEISEDLPLPIDITRRYVKLLVQEQRLAIIKRLVPQTNNVSHLIVSIEIPCDCFPGEPMEFSDDLRARRI